MRLPYLDCVLKETLRKYPVLARLERRVNVEKYSLGEQQQIPLVKDQLVEVPVVAVHYNPDLFPEPFTFNPDRFSAENKHRIVPYSFIPFGDGPRNCEQPITPTGHAPRGRVPLMMFKVICF